MSVSDTVRRHGPKPRTCGCKGIRSCRLCSEKTDSSEQVLTPKTIFDYCPNCKKAWHVEGTSLPQSYHIGHQTTESEPENNFATVEDQSSSDTKTTDLEKHNDIQVHPSVKSFSSKPVIFSINHEINGSGVNGSDVISKEVCNHTNTSHAVDFEGILIVENFITEEEEAYLISSIAKTQFMNSQSGRRKQDYGPKVNFKKQKVQAANFNGLPSYSHFLYLRMKSHPFLSSFEPVELCNLEYCKDRGAHIDAHFDDDWLWGERLVTLNLLSSSTLTFTLDSEPTLEVRVPLSQRSLIVVSSTARYKWKHSILTEDIQERRIAMTFRELSDIFSPGGDREHEGTELLKLALSFEGCAVSG